MADRNAAIHLVAGGAGGTVGAVVTCPLEVIKVRLQSSAGLSCNGNGQNPGPSTSALSEELRHSNKGSFVDYLGMIPKGMRRIIPSWSLDPAFTNNAAFLHEGPGFKNSGTPGGSRGKCSGEGGKKLFVEDRFSGPQIQKKGGGFLGSGFRSGAPYRGLLELHSRSLASSASAQAPGRLGTQVYRHLRHIVKIEGVLALWKGCIPNLVGVAPSKAVYFYAYSTSKRVLNDFLVPNTAWVHMWSAAGAGFIAATVVNPIWLIKTRLQLDRTPEVKAMSISQVIRKVYKADGLKGFYRGVTASYAGISETIIQFVIYEWLKARFVAQEREGGKRHTMDFLSFMACGSTGKLVATVLCYPHEVVRTRLREEGTKYRRFWQTLLLVWREERRMGLYRGLGVHLLRTIPNTAITMTTYELVVYLLMRL